MSFEIVRILDDCWRRGGAQYKPIAEKPACTEKDRFAQIWLDWELGWIHNSLFSDAIDSEPSCGFYCMQTSCLRQQFWLFRRTVKENMYSHFVWDVCVFDCTSARKRNRRIETENTSKEKVFRRFRIEKKEGKAKESWKKEPLGFPSFCPSLKRKREKERKEKRKGKEKRKRKTTEKRSGAKPAEPSNKGLMRMDTSCDVERCALRGQSVQCCMKPDSRKHQGLLS